MIDPHTRLKNLLEREGTNISWADFTMNFWLGCQEVSPACDHCYARTFVETRLNASRAHAGLEQVVWGPGGARQRTSESNRRKPLRWNRIAGDAGVTLNVFSSSLSDVFDNAVDPTWRWDLGKTIIATPNLRWMLLTKRIGNARDMLTQMFDGVVPENVALGVTIVNQEEADRDMPKALSVKAGLGIRRLFVSMEPLLERVDLRRYLGGVDLLIVGGESGKGARSFPETYAVVMRVDCKLAGVPFHLKQLSQADHPRTYEKPETFPPALQIREHFA